MKQAIEKMAMCVTEGLFALLVCVLCTAEGAFVTEEQVATAAQAWVRQGGEARGGFGQYVEKAVLQEPENAMPFYAVKMYGGGTIFMSSDTTERPVIGFTTSTDDFSTFDTESPMWALLSRDGMASLEVAANTPVVAARPSVTAAEQEWAELLADDDASTLCMLDMGSGKTLTEEQIRVDPLVATQWGQSSFDTAKTCFNLYTPKNYVCGCVATAMAQIMRFWKFPTAEVKPITKLCSVDGTQISLTMKGGTYDWENMPEKKFNEEGEKDDQIKAMGTLTYDCGVSVGMMYSSSGSGAYADDVQAAFKDTFGYKNAEWKYGGGSGIPVSEFSNVLYANFDAGCPVEMSIYGRSAGGHAVVGDGYGFVGNRPYIHINMGWTGSKDMWYNVPDMDTDWYVFTVFSGVCYNIFPEKDGDILSGRILDGDEEPIEGATVKVFRASDIGMTSPIDETTTDAKGIYAFILPDSGNDDYFVYAEAADPYDPSRTLMDASETIILAGNRWGNDLVLCEPTVRIGTTGYTRLDKALAAAEDGDVVEILLPTAMKESVMLTNSVTIMATNENALLSAVMRVNDAAITVTNAANVTLANVVFTNSAVCLVDVKSNACVTIGNKVDLGIVSDCVAIRTADSTGFALAGNLERGILLQANGSHNDGEQFGTFSCEQSVAEASVALISNAYDKYGEIRGKVVVEGNKLVWGRVDVPLADAAGYFVDGEGKTNTFARIDRAFESFAKDWAEGKMPSNPKLVVRRSGSLATPLVVGGDMILAGEEDVAFTNLAPTAGFTITNGTLSVQSLGFADYRGNAAFLVKGGVLAMKDVALNGLRGTNGWSGAIAVLKGSAALTNVVFDACQAVGDGTGNGGQSIYQYKESYGGALYLADETKATLLDVTATNCVARNHGGAIYAAPSSVLTIGGAMHLCGNIAGEGYASTQEGSVINGEEDICFGSADDRLIVSSEGLTGGEKMVGVTFADNVPRANTNGAYIASIAAVESGAAKNVAAASVFNTEYANVIAEVADAGASLVWAEGPDPRICPTAEGAQARVWHPDGTCVNWCALDDAVASATNGCRVEVLQNAALTQSWNVPGVLEMFATNAEPLVITRAADAAVALADAAAALVVSNMVFEGVDTVVYTEPLFDVRGGSLTLDAAIVQNLTSTGSVVYLNGGSLALENGTTIKTCINLSTKNNAGAGKASGLAGAIFAQYGSLCFGASGIRGCAATFGGGVYAAKNVSIAMAGEQNLAYNSNTNLYVLPGTVINLTEPVTGKVGVTYKPVSGDTNTIARVNWNWSTDLAALRISARTFTRDVVNASATAVTNDASAYIVWATALTEEGYIDIKDGATTVRCWRVEDSIEPDPPAPPEPEPPELKAFAFSVISNNAATWYVTITNAVKDCTYGLHVTNSLEGNFPIGARVNEPVDTKKATADGSLEFQYSGDGKSSLFFRVSGSNEE